MLFDSLLEKGNEEGQKDAREEIEKEKGLKAEGKVHVPYIRLEGGGIEGGADSHLVAPKEEELQREKAELVKHHDVVSVTCEEGNRLEGRKRRGKQFGDVQPKERSVDAEQEGQDVFPLKARRKRLVKDGDFPLEKPNARLQEKGKPEAEENGEGEEGLDRAVEHSEGEKGQEVKNPKPEEGIALVVSAVGEVCAEDAETEVKDAEAAFFYAFPLRSEAKIQRGVDCLRAEKGRDKPGGGGEAEGVSVDEGIDDQIVKGECAADCYAEGAGAGGQNAEEGVPCEKGQEEAKKIALEKGSKTLRLLVKIAGGKDKEHNVKGVKGKKLGQKAERSPKVSEYDEQDAECV